MRVVGILGSCQVNGIAKCLAFVCPEIRVVTANVARLAQSGVNVAATLAECDVVFAQPTGITLQNETRRMSPIVFRGFQPDGVYAYRDGKPVNFARTGAYTSAIALYAWSNGASLEQTKALFRHEVFEAVGYFDVWRRDAKLLSETSARTDLPLGTLVGGWLRKPAFMYVLNHPQLHVLADVAREIARSLDVPTKDERAEDSVPDRLKRLTRWPVYPGIAGQFGLTGSYRFKIVTGTGGEKQRIECELDGFLERCFADYAAFRPGDLRCDFFDDRRFRTLDTFLEAGSRHLHFMPKTDYDAYTTAASIVCDEELLDPQ